MFLPNKKNKTFYCCHGDLMVDEAVEQVWGSLLSMGVAWKKQKMRQYLQDKIGKKCM